MKTRFNYFTYSFVFLLLIVFVIIAFNYLTIFQIIRKGERNLIPFYIGMTCVAFGLVYGVYVFCFTLSQFKKVITFDKNQLIVMDALTKKTVEIPFEFIDNLLLENFVYKTAFTSLTITIKSGKKYRILNFFTLNFKDVSSQLKLLKQKKSGLKILIKTNTIANEWISITKRNTSPNIGFCASWA